MEGMFYKVNTFLLDRFYMYGNGFVSWTGTFSIEFRKTVGIQRIQKVSPGSIIFASQGQIAF